MTKDPQLLRTAYGLLLQKQAHDLDRERLAETSRTSRDKAVEALLAEAEGNEAAKALLQQFLAAIESPAATTP